MGNTQAFKLNMICNCLKDSQKINNDLLIQIEAEQTLQYDQLIIKIIMIQSHFRRAKARKKFVRKLFATTTAKSFEEGLDLNLTKSVDNYFFKTSDISNKLGAGKSLRKITRRSKPSISYIPIDENNFPSYHEIIKKAEQQNGKKFKDNFIRYNKKQKKLFEITNENKTNEFISPKIGSDSSLRKVVIKYSDNSYYKGFLNSDNKRESYGIFIFKDLSKYEGNFRENNMDGFGRLSNIDGAYYEGEFKKNKFQGMGVLINPNGDKYKGSFVDGIKHGEGEEIYNNGFNFYKGTFKENMKNGHGKLIRNESFVYQGSFFNDAMEGKGLGKWKDGRVYNGEWKSDQMHGKGIFCWQNGDKYFGMYENDKKSGSGVFLWNNEKKYEGQWLNGKQHGLGLFTSGTSVIYGVWDDGNLVQNNCKNKNVTYDIMLIELKYLHEEICENFGEYLSDVHFKKFLLEANSL